MRRVQNLGHLLGIGKALVNVADHAPEVPQPPEHRDKIALDECKVPDGQESAAPETDRKIHNEEFKRHHERRLRAFNHAAQAPREAGEQELFFGQRAEPRQLVPKGREDFDIDVVGDGVGKSARDFGVCRGRGPVVFQFIHRKEIIDGKKHREPHQHEHSDCGMPVPENSDGQKRPEHHGEHVQVHFVRDRLKRIHKAIDAPHQ